jgi:glycosyltransferase involved in cell wall biosynthesis
LSDTTSPLFTVLLPVIRPPTLLPYAIESVLDQSVADFELFVICDGASPETIACAEDYAQRDSRVKVFPFPKGKRQGEAHRHVALASAAGRYVAQIADDDLWFPNHLEEMEILLASADFGNLLHVFVRPAGAIEILPGDIALPETRERMLTEKFNLFGPTCAGYRMEAYRRLPEGWAPAPEDIWTDLHMWRKFLRMDGLAFATRAAITALVFATPERLDVTPEQRREEIRVYLERIRDPRRRNQIVEAAWRSLLEQARQNDREILALTAAHGRSAAALDALQAERVRPTKEFADKVDEINRMRQSMPWRLTTILRKIFRLANRREPMGGSANRRVR